MNTTDSHMIPALETLYRVYDEVTTEYRFACGPGCATCCSVNVVVTSLEVSYLRMANNWTGGSLVDAVSAAAQQTRYTPSCTTNTVAAYCLAGQDPPDDPGEHGLGRCPLLDGHGRCRVYAHRPFACRSMSSGSVCRPGGEAVMDPFLFTLNLGLCQVIEHLDRAGCSGNLLDMLLTEKSIPADLSSVANRALPGFLVPPEEQSRFQAVMERFLDAPVADHRLRDFLPL